MTRSTLRRDAPTAILGGGHVGLVTAAVLAESGYDVIVRDVDPARVAQLKRLKIPFHEPGLRDAIAANRRRITFTSRFEDVAAASPPIVYVAVGTPALADGGADLRALWAGISDLETLQDKATLVMKSTVPVGTGASIKARLDQRGLTHLSYVANPEFLAEGSALKDALNPDRVVIGSFVAADGDAIAQLYAGIDTAIVTCSVETAEMIKLASNLFLAARISLINEVANMCDLVGGDVNTVAYAIGLDRRIGTHHLKAGLGFGGPCFEKDLASFGALAERNGYDFQMLRAVRTVNQRQREGAFDRLRARLGRLVGKKVAILGLAFKTGTSDLADAPSVALIERIVGAGAEVTAWDPLVPVDALEGVSRAASPIAAVSGADAAIIVTEWSDVATLCSAEAHGAMRRPFILDARNMLAPDAMRALGFEYEGVGRGRG